MAVGRDARVEKGIRKGGKKPLEKWLESGIRDQVTRRSSGRARSVEAEEVEGTQDSQEGREGTKSASLED